MSKKRKPRRQKTEFQELRDKLDYISKRLVRRYAANEGGIAECYTCSKLMPWQKGDAGHFISCGRIAVRWDVKRNIRFQCKGCNSWGKSKFGARGEPILFERRLRADGIDVDQLRRDALGPRPTIEEMEIMLDEFEQISAQLDKSERDGTRWKNRKVTGVTFGL